MAVAVAALLLLVGRAVAAVYVDYRWYEALGAESLWRTRAGATLLLHGLSGLVAAAFVFANLYAVRSSVISLVLPRRVANLEIGEEVPGRYLVGAAALVSIALGALLAIPQERWTTLALARLGRPFGESEPYLERDLGFFVYWLPLERALYVWAMVALLVVTTLVILLYALTPSLRWEHGTLRVSNYVRRHLVVLAAILLLLLAWSYRLDTYATLLDGGGPEGAFGYAEHRAAIPVNVGLSILTLVSAALVWWSGWTGQLRIAFIAVGMVLLLSVTLRHLSPALAGRFARVQDPATRERPYEATRARYTRRAYALDQIAPADSSLAFPSLGAAAPFVSLWDPGALATALQRSRRHEGVAVGVGWQVARSGLIAVVPEKPPAVSDPANPVPWSVVRVTAWAADSRGEPIRVSRDGSRSDEEERVDPALVADSAPGYLVLADSLRRIAAASLGDGWSRLAHAWSLQNFRLVFGDLPQPNPRIITRRNVRERLRFLAPFFAQGSVIHPLVWADTLFWAVDLFATSTSYPLSYRATLGGQEWRYVQRAATGLVNAHTGRATLIVDSPLDPLAESWVSHFPGLFTRRSRLPAALTSVLPPPVDLARTQAVAFARVGSRDRAAVRGHVPWNDGADTAFASDAQPFFVLPERDSALAWTIPVLDDGEQVTGVLIVTGGEQRRTYWLASGLRGVRWSTVVDQLHRVPEAPGVIPRDTRVLRGTVRALPVRGSLAFVQPTYTWRSGSAPALERVHIFADGAVTSAPSLAAAGAGTPTGDTASPLSPQSFRARVAALYEEMRSALRRSDWSAFGRAYNELGELLRVTPP